MSQSELTGLVIQNQATKGQDLLSNWYVTTQERKVLINKRRLKNTEISVTENLIKCKMEFFKNTENESGFNYVWIVDERLCYCDEVAEKGVF